MPDVPPPQPPAIIEQCSTHADPAIMSRIVRVESAGRPHAIGYYITRQGREFRLTRQPRDAREAAEWARWLLDNGYRFDAGAAQVNSMHFKRFGMTPDTLFDPCVSISAGSQIFGEFHAQAVRRFGPSQQAVAAAVSAYQSGNFTTGHMTGYVGRVLSGSATPPSITPSPAAHGPRRDRRTAQAPVETPATAGTSVPFPAVPEPN